MAIAKYDVNMMVFPGKVLGKWFAFFPLFNHRKRLLSALLLCVISGLGKFGSINVLEENL